MLIVYRNNPIDCSEMPEWPLSATRTRAKHCLEHAGGRQKGRESGQRGRAGCLKGGNQCPGVRGGWARVGGSAASARESAATKG
jgi:hypothetical protein